MLAMSDVNIDQFFSIFANTGVSVAFLVPTPTGYGKSIMDATAPVRELFKESGLHDYELKGQGQESKVVIESFFVYHDRLEKSYASLYRPVTKKGDPRIWFKDLKRYCSPCNLLSLIIIEKRIYVINLSNPSIASSLQSKGFVFDILLEAAHKDRLIADELLSRIQEIHSLGFIPSITPGDPGVGDTLEHALGIERNNSRSPDYKGIELKATRLTRNGSSRQTTRSTLFTKVPDVGMSYREIIDNYGKVQIPRGETIARLQLYETFRVSRPNAYDLVLDVDANNDQLRMLHQELTSRKFVSAWYMNTLKQALLLKHHETFWVKALSETRNGREFFRYDKILHTKNPNTSLLAPLFEADKITVDLAAHYKPDGKWRDHGVLFKMMPDDLPLLLGTPIEYDLTK
jgi:hypothetical protein